MIDFLKVGERIAFLRRERELSQEELASELFVTRQALSKWERGASAPSIDTLIAMSRRFGVSVESILCLDDAVSDVDPLDVFAGHDRRFIVNEIAQGNIHVNLPDVFYQFSPLERMLLLRKIREGTLSVDREELWVKLTGAEQKYLGGSHNEIHEG